MSFEKWINFITIAKYVWCVTVLSPITTADVWPNNTSGCYWDINAKHYTKYARLLTSHNMQQQSLCVCVISDSVVVLLCFCQMAYVTEIRLSGGWSGVAPSSCPEVELEVIEEYLQEHSLEVQPAHMPASPQSTMGQQPHTLLHQGGRIIGKRWWWWLQTGCWSLCVCESFIWRPFSSTENSWSGQHAYEWHCGSNTPYEEYEEQAPPPAWPCPHDNQWVSSGGLKLFAKSSLISSFQLIGFIHDPWRLCPGWIIKMFCMCSGPHHVFLRGACIHWLRLAVQLLPVPGIPRLTVPVLGQGEREGQRLPDSCTVFRYKYS